MQRAGAIPGSDFVAGFGVCVYVLGDLRELFESADHCGDGEPGVRARAGRGYA